MGERAEVHIISEGDGQRTVIVKGDEEIKHVTGATIYLEAGEVNKASLDIILQSVDVKTLVADITFTCPCCGELISHDCPEPTLGGSK